jgi:hypothetical protein
MYNKDVGEPNTDGVETDVMYFQRTLKNSDLKASVYNNLSKQLIHYLLNIKVIIYS